MWEKEAHGSGERRAMVGLVGSAAIPSEQNGKWVMVNEEMGSGGLVVEWMGRIGCWWYVWVGHGERMMEVWW